MGRQQEETVLHSTTVKKNERIDLLAIYRGRRNVHIRIGRVPSETRQNGRWQTLKKKLK